MQHEKVLNMFEKVCSLPLSLPTVRNNECNNEKNDYSFRLISFAVFYGLVYGVFNARDLKIPSLIRRLS